MWTPKKSNKSSSNRMDVNGRTYMTPYSQPFGPSSAVSNESGGNNTALHNNIRRSFTPCFQSSYALRSSTNSVGLPSGLQQTQGGSSSMRNTSHILTNEPSQLSLGSSHGYSGITKTGVPPLIPNKPPLVLNKGHTDQRIVNSFGGYISADSSSSSSSNWLANVSSPASGLNLSAPCIVSTPGNSPIRAPMPISNYQFQDGTGHFSYMRLLNDSNGDAAANVGVNDLCHMSGYYSSVGDPQDQPGLKQTNHFSFFQHNQYSDIPNEDFSPWSPYEGSLNIGGLVDYSTTQSQQEHLVQPQQYPVRRSPGFMFGALNASHYHLQPDHDFSINETGFSFPTLGNQDLHFHGFGQYQHFQQPHHQPRFSNRKEVAQGSLLGPDDYGLLGLLKIIKGANPSKISLAMGVDPHSLVLDLNSLEPLHQKFASPWSHEPVKEGPKYDVPDCYNSKQPPPLKGSHFKKFHLAMLFYIFYSMPQDQAQLFAANELHDRSWYFHRELRMWFTRDKNSEPAVKNSTYEVGSYICFDPSTWQTIRQENVVLHYEMVEQRPIVPT